MFNVISFGRRPGPFALFLAAALVAGGSFAPAAAAPPAKSAPTALPMADQKAPENPQFRILAPADGAVVAPGKVLVIGRMPEGGGRVDLVVDGSSAGQATVDRDGFYAPVTLSDGKNTIAARSGKKETVIAVTADAKPGYAWHPAVEKCTSCHPASEKGFKMGAPKDKMCYRCHQRKDRRKNVHGPMGAGECTACHDLHGSSHKSLTVAEPLTLCALCHDQKSSEQHMRNSKGKPCIQCHDPHASDKPYHQK